MSFQKLFKILQNGALVTITLFLTHPLGGTDLERGYGDVRPWRRPFHASPATRKGSISSKRVSSQDPLFRKFGNFSLNSLNVHPNFSSQAPKFGNFQLTSPQIWKFSAHKPPFSEANVSLQAPHFGNPGRTPLPEKKLSAPPPGLTLYVHEVRGDTKVKDHLRSSCKIGWKCEIVFVCKLEVC